MKDRIKRLLPRKFQTYCVGAAKTGSTSLAAMFSPSFRAVHEPAVKKTNQLIIDWLEGKLERAELNTRLIERDRRLKLELESAHPLGYISDVLAEIFPKAKFVITLREPYSWLQSRFNYHYKVDSPSWRAYRDYFWTKRHSGYAPEEKVLEKLGLCSMDTYLSQYADHYRRVLNQIPKDRTLLLKTSEIDRSIPQLANFLGIQEKKLRIARKNQSSEKIEPLNEIDPKFVKSKIWYHCQDIIAAYFPEKASDYQ
jgi:hypothetical protein